MKYHQPYGISDPNGAYINGNPSTGTMGSIPPAASIEFPQREIVNLISDAGLAPPDDADLRQLSKAIQSTLLWSDDDAGTANALQVTQTPAPPAYRKYLTVVCKVANLNTGASTLNVNALGAKPIVHVDGTALSAGELRANQICCFIYDGVNFQLVWSSTQTIGGGGPIFLTANADWYVNNTTGSDTLYDGTSATIVAGTIHGPFRTIQKACTQVSVYNLNNYNVTIHVADGDYSGFTAGVINGSGNVILTGNTANPAACRIVGSNQTAALFVNTRGIYTFTGFELTSVGSAPTDPCSAIAVYGNTTTVYLGNLNFNTCPAGHISVSNGALCSNLQGCNWILKGGSPGNGPTWNGFHAVSCIGGNFNCVGGNVNYSIPNPISFAGEFFYCFQFAQLAINAVYSGAGNVSGKKYNVVQLSMIQAAGVTIPGNIAGTSDPSTGGYFI